MSDVDALSDAFLAVEPTYRALGERVERILDRGRSAAGIKGTVSSRPKDVDSFIKKAIRKGYADPMIEIKDKAGARIVVVFKDDVALVREMVRESFVVHHEEDKIADLGSTKLGYQGVHFEVALRTEDIGDASEFQDLICEIQIHTRAQSAWAEASHELVYKAITKPPLELERRVMLLQAIVEMFDREIVAIKDDLVKSEQRATQILAILEPHFLRLAGANYDEELSVAALTMIDPLYGDEDIDDIEQRLTRFIDDNRVKLEKLFTDYKAEGKGTNPFLLQPESVSLFERLEHDKFAVLDAWDGRFDTKLLERLAAGWGIPLPDSA